MIKRVHEHIISELQQNARTDTIFVLTAILLNLLTLAINSSIAKDSRTDTSLFITIQTFEWIDEDVQRPRSRRVL